jgi:hypothetical protein
MNLVFVYGTPQTRDQKKCFSHRITSSFQLQQFSFLLVVNIITKGSESKKEKEISKWPLCSILLFF